jgi:hypothetical protein
MVHRFGRQRSSTSETGKIGVSNTRCTRRPLVRSGAAAGERWPLGRQALTADKRNFANGRSTAVNCHDELPRPNRCGSGHPIW